MSFFNTMFGGRTLPGNGRQNEKRARVLIVEDEYLMALTIESLVHASGYDVVGLASSVEAGLESVRRGGIDAALLDVNLRGKLVTPVAKALADSAIPYILVTAYEHSWFAEPVLRDVPCVGKVAMQRELPLVMAQLLASRQPCATAEPPAPR